MTVAWFTIEDLGALVRRHRVDDSVTKAIARTTRTDLTIVDLCRDRTYAERAVRIVSFAGKRCGEGGIVTALSRPLIGGGPT